MGVTLDALHRLQEVELQIAEVQQQIARRQRAVKKQEKRVAGLEATIGNQESALRTDQMEADRLDLDIKSREVEIAKLRQALNTAKTNKDYSAILTQLNTYKANNSKIEERVLSIFTQLEAKRKEIAAIREQRDEEAAKLEEHRAARREIENASKDRLAGLDQERAKAAVPIPGAAMTVFNRAAKKNDGEAMALVSRTHPKRGEYACEGCNMSVTLEQVNVILSRDEAILCNSCGRILYFNSPGAPTAQ